LKTKIDNIQANLGGEPCHIDLERSPPALECFELATEDEVIKTIINSPCKTSPQDPIPTWLLKENLSMLAPSITGIINMSLTTTTFPDRMKTAIVRPLLKKSTLDPEQFSNYRPVSNLSFLSKVLERIVSARITKHMATHDLHEPTQSAYRQYHGTETTLVRVMNDILCALDNKQGAYLVLLDLSAAFDTIHHDTLKCRLESDIGLQGTVLQWVVSYLADRSQQVSVSGATSDPVSLSYGVPQGSVLGPKLFTVYSAPIATICRQNDLQVQMYADDSQLYLFFDWATPGMQGNIKMQVEKGITCI